MIDETDIDDDVDVFKKIIIENGSTIFALDLLQKITVSIQW